MTKPTISIKQGCDMYGLHLNAMAALKKAGLQEQLIKLRQRGLDAQSFHEMLNLVLEYVTVERK